MSEKDLIVMNKLEYLKEIRYRMNEIERLRQSINEELDLVNVEEKCLQEYRREMDSLYQEKMTHVEELRQIHSDINMLENVLKQSEEDRNRHVDNVKRLHHHLQQMKDGVEKMRIEIGLPARNLMNENNNNNLNSNHNQKDEDSLIIDKLDLVLDNTNNSKRNSNNSIKNEQHFDKSTTSTALDPLIAKQLSSSSSNKPFADNTNTSIVSASSTNNNNKSSGNLSGSYSSSLASLMSGFQDLHTSSGRIGQNISTGSSSSSYDLSTHGQHPLSSSSATGSATSSMLSSNSVSSAAAAAFRQQPPPMKSCLSCHQQIHRNAPICPLCKAKSRSRHPKRRNQTKPKLSSFFNQSA